jgi:hypothetical protein
LALDVQLVVHALLPQMKGEHALVVGVTHVPVPVQLQVAGVSSPLRHEAGPHVVPAGVSRQLPVPLQVPSLPHGGAGLQRVSVYAVKKKKHIFVFIQAVSPLDENANFDAREGRRVA